MSEIKYGELGNWNDGNVSGGSNDFMNLVEGQNQVRLFTNPYQYAVHWAKDTTGANRKIKCALEGCPLCKSGVKLQYRWFVGVIDRSDGKAKILEISSQVYQGIKLCSNIPQYGDPRGYDIIINRGPKGSQPLYSVMPTPPTPFADEEKVKIRDFKENTQLAKLTQPYSVEEVIEKMGGVPAQPQMTVGHQNISTVSTDAPVSKPVIDDDEFNFEDDDLE